MCILLLLPLPKAEAADLMHVDRFTTDDGLSHRFISTIEEDSAGVIWMATWNGICRWDSIHGFQTINESRDGQKLGRLLVVSPVEGGLLWCLEQNKDRKFLFNPETRELTPAEDRFYRRGGTKPWQLTLDSTGLTLVRPSSRPLSSSSSSAADFSSRSRYFIPYPEGHNPDPDNRMVGLLDSRERLWVNWDDALWRITFSPPLFVHETEDGEEIRALLHRADGQIWAASKIGNLSVYDSEGLLLTRMKTVPKVYCMDEADSTVWLGSKGNGLLRWHGGQLSSVAGSPKDIYDIWIHDSLLWMGTWGQGLVSGMVADNRLTCMKEQLPSLKIRRLSPMKDGRLAVCTTQGLYQLCLETGVTTVAGDADFSDICEVNDTLTLLGSMGTGLYRLCPDDSIRNYHIEGVPDIILSMLRCGDEVWIVGDDALVTWRPGYEPRVLDSRFWGESIDFSEARPVACPQPSPEGKGRGEMQFGTTRGRLVLHPGLLPPLRPIPSPGDSSGGWLWWLTMAAIIVGGSVFWMHDWRKSRIPSPRPPEGGGEDVAVTVPGGFPAGTEPSPFEKQLRAFIEAHYAESNLNADTIAESMAMSRTALFERVKQELHTTPASLLLDVRLAHATEMLRSGEKSIPETAWLCGFSDAKYFSKVYKKQTGISPREVAIE